VPAAGKRRRADREKRACAAMVVVSWLHVQHDAWSIFCSQKHSVFTSLCRKGLSARRTMLESPQANAARRRFRKKQARVTKCETQAWHAFMQFPQGERARAQCICDGAENNSSQPTSYSSESFLLRELCVGLLTHVGCKETQVLSAHAFLHSHLSQGTFWVNSETRSKFRWHLTVVIHNVPSPSVCLDHQLLPMPCPLRRRCQGQHAGPHAHTVLQHRFSAAALCHALFTVHAHCVFTDARRHTNVSARG